MAFMKSFESCSRLVSASLLPQLSQLTYSFLLGNCEVIGTIPKKRPHSPKISHRLCTQSGDSIGEKGRAFLEEWRCPKEKLL